MTLGPISGLQLSILIFVLMVFGLLPAATNTAFAASWEATLSAVIPSALAQ